MPANTVRHQHRHFKTLIVLVLSMTGGTMFLFWVGGLAPVTPLRGRIAADGVWRQISVRAADDRSPRGFFHFRIDRAGELQRSLDWGLGQADPRTPGTVQVLVSCDAPDAGLTPAQTRTLSSLISELRGQHGIPKERVRIERGP